MAQGLRHQDGIAVPHVDNLIELIKLDNGGNEFITDALDTVLPDFLAHS